MTHRRAEMDCDALGTSCANGSGAKAALDSKLTAAPGAALRVLNQLQQGDWAPAEYKLQVEYPFHVECKTQPWIVQLLGLCNGAKTGRETAGSHRLRADCPGNVTRPVRAGPRAVDLRGLSSVRLGQQYNQLHLRRRKISRHIGRQVARAHYSFPGHAGLIQAQARPTVNRKNRIASASTNPAWRGRPSFARATWPPTCRVTSLRLRWS